MRPLAAAACLAFGLLLPALGCNTYADDLARSQRAFEQSEHERALAILRALEPDTQRLSLVDRGRYSYLRGMTDYRIGYRGEARHWLALASSIEKESPGALPHDWAKRMNEALKDLNDAVYAGGIASLSNTPAPAANAGDNADESDDEAPAPPAKKPADE
jgi:hypothetical protein